eukprot:g1473.t1
MGSRQKKNTSEDLESLIKVIGDCKCKSEEDRVMFRIIEATKSAIKTGVVDKNRTKYFLVQLIYVEMLGYDSNFGHFLAVQACGSNSVMTKLMGYLAVGQLLDSSDSLILLLVNTWRSDLQHENHVVVCAALTAVCKLVNADAVGALVQQVVSLLQHQNATVRKKALLALHRFCQIDPQGETGLAGIDVKSLLSQSLSDPDPTVMSASLCAIHEMSKINPDPFRCLIPNLSFILKQVFGNQLDKSYEYQYTPAPFLQMHILRILALLGTGDKSCTDQMKNILLTVLRNVNLRNSVGYAVLFECIRTMTTVSPDTQLLEQAATSVFKFLHSDNSHNLKYMGLDALGGIVSISFRQAQDHQTAVMDCLEDPDETLKLKTLELLYRMTKSSNVEIVVQKLIQYLRSCSDKHIQYDICSKVTDLAERYAPDRFWYVEMMFEMFEAAGDGALLGAEQTLLHLISEQDTELHKFTVQLSLKFLMKRKSSKNLLQVVCWILGEYGSLVNQLLEQKMSAIEVQEALCELMRCSNQDNVVQGYILSALGKLSARTQGKLSRDAEELIENCLFSRSSDLQQRALEIQSFINNGNGTLLSTVLPYGGTSENLEAIYTQIETLSFLDGFVEDALANGASKYVPEADRDELGFVCNPAEKITSSGGLKIDAYGAPEVPKQSPVLAKEAPVFKVQTPVVNQTSIPAVAAAIAVANAQKPTLKLPGVQTRRWGPVSSPEAIQEPPVLHMATGKLQYSKSAPEKTLVTSVTKSTKETTLFRQSFDRDNIMGSLFGDASADIKETNGHIGVKNSNKTPKRKTQSFSTPSQETSIIPELDVLDLTGQQDSTTTTTLNKGTESPVDPFWYGFHDDANPTKSATAINLDALYTSPQNTISTAFAPQTIPVMMTSHRNTGIGMVSGVGHSTGGNQVFTNLANQAKKDDPFKDLLS